MKDIDGSPGDIVYQTSSALTCYPKQIICNLVMSGDKTGMVNVNITKSGTRYTVQNEFSGVFASNVMGRSTKIFTLDATQKNATSYGGEYEIKSWLDGSKIVSLMTKDGYVIKQERFIQNGDMHVSSEINGAKATEIYCKA